MKPALFFPLAALLFSVTSLCAAPSEPEPETSTAPANAVSLYNDGTAALKTLDFPAAETLLRSALELNPDFAQAHNNLAYTLRKQGKFEEALASYNRAIELAPDLSEAYMYRGVLHVQMQRREAAEADLATLKTLSAPLAAELAYVIENGREKEPEQFFGVTAVQ